jgi:hypothetical protein
MRIVPEHGVIEIGSILWGPAIAGTRLATEAFALFARHVFDELGYVPSGAEDFERATHVFEFDPRPR